MKLSTLLLKDIFPINRNLYILKQNFRFCIMRLKVSSNLGPKGWKPEDCPYRLCKVFVQDIGFLEKTTWKKYTFKLLKASWKCYSKFDTLRLGNTHLCSVCVFCTVKQCKEETVSAILNFVT